MIGLLKKPGNAMDFTTAWLVIPLFLIGPSANLARGSFPASGFSAIPANWIIAEALVNNGNLDSCIDDSKITQKLISDARDLMQKGSTKKMGELIGQLGRKECKVELAEGSSKKMSAAELYEKCKNSVLVVGLPYKCNKCTRWHCHGGSGFIISKSGAFATNYHMVNQTERETMVAMTFDGKVYAVREVLAASKEDDIAILQLDGIEFTHLPILKDAPVGTEIHIISHPCEQYYTLTQGVISRYFTTHVGTQETARMAVTADYAKGSSGAPLLNEYGAVVGVVSQTLALYVKKEDGTNGDPQMVLKHCIPSQALLNLLGMGH